MTFLIFSSVLTLAFFVFPFSFLTSSSAITLKTVSGRVLPIDEVQKRVPHLSVHSLKDALYEQNEHGDLHNHQHVLRVRKVAPHFERVVLEREIVGESDGRTHIIKELVTRKGPNATFVYSQDGRSILSAWGPDFNLRPLNKSKYPGVFINSRAGLVLPSFVHESLQVSSHDFDGIYPVDEIPVKRLERHSALTSTTSLPGERMDAAPKKERRLLELFVLHERTFCKSFASPVEAHSVLSSHIANLKPLFAATGLEPEASRIVGPCTNETKFKLPANVENCPADSPSCSRTALLLRYYRTYPAYKHRRRDLTIIFTNYTNQDDTFHGVVGAAYVGATCNRKFGWGWVHETDVNDIVFAHEVAHSLGALHETEGIMKPAVGNSTENIGFSPKSIALMNQFVEKAASTWCLKKLKWEFDALKFSVPRSVVSWKMLAHDLSFAKFHGSSKATVLVGITSKTTDGLRAEVAFLEDVHPISDGFSGGPWKGGYKIPNVKPYKQGGLGVAFGHIRSSDSNDIVIGYLKSPQAMEYVVGFGMSINDNNGFSVEEWSEVASIPFDSSTGPAESIGIAVGDIQRDGKLDLVVGYVLGNGFTRYKVGKYIGSDGMIKEGWSPRRYLQPTLSSTVLSISVALITPPGERVSHAVFYTNEKLGARFQSYYRVAKNVNTKGVVVGGWTTGMPAQVSPVQAKAGGIAIDFLDGIDEPTTAVMQSASFAKAGQPFSFLDFGFNITSGILADSNGSIFESILYGRDAGCNDCYKGVERATCLERMKLCEERKYDNVQSSALSTMTTRNEAKYSDTVYCVGFHKVFISPEGDTCDRDSSREYVSSEGLSVYFRESLMELMNQYSNLSEIDRSFETETGVEYDTNGVDDPSEVGRKVKIYRPNQMRLKLKRSGNLWKNLVHAALKKLRTRAGVQATFQDVKETSITREGGTTFIILLRFDIDFREEWVQKEIWRPYGTANSVW